jgi:hypothetical protein
MMHVIVLLRPSMRMQVPVRDTIVLMAVAVHSKCAHQSKDAKPDEGHANEALDGRRERVGKTPTREYEHATHDQDDDRVA